MTMDNNTSGILRITWHMAMERKPLILGQCTKANFTTTKNKDLGRLSGRMAIIMRANGIRICSTDTGLEGLAATSTLANLKTTKCTDRVS